MAKRAMTTGALCVVLAVLLAVPAVPVRGQTYVTSLRTGALLGESSSAARLRALVRSHRDRLLTAAAMSGLNHGERLALLQRLRRGRMQWRILPRRLDTMAWLARGSVRVLRDVVIPARTYGWEIDVPSARGNLWLFLPAACGNLSMIRTPLPVSRGEVTLNSPPVVRLHPYAAPFEIAPPPVDVLAYAPEMPQLAAPPEAKHHAFPWWLLALLLPFAGGSSGGGSSPIVITPTPLPPSTFVCWEEPIAQCDSPGIAKRRTTTAIVRFRIP